ncbi:MAG TPA: ABC transporter ATP-binding protein [Opitutaceae bacterium]|nr:ABC transporter ATP-binding protein [Opitutaceae bacterium]
MPSPAFAPAPTASAANTADASPVVFRSITQRFGKHTALTDVSLALPAGRIIGLLGRNGAGKTTLLHIAAGLLPPTAGDCTTLGTPCGKLDTPQLTRLGLVQQEGRYLEWMTVRQHLDFNASFYPRWDRDLEKRLLEALELDPKRKIVQLSPGDRQKVGILLGTCHRPALLLLDEPISSLDPIVRKRLLDFLLELLRDDGTTVVISSHILNDVEKIVDWIVALEAGELVENSPFDLLQESYAEWTLTSANGALPATFAEPFVLSRQGDARQAVLRVRTADPEAAARFAATHHAELRTRPLNLDEMFPLLTDQRRRRA